MRRSLKFVPKAPRPIVFTTGAFGNAFAFLMGGVVTDLTEIGLVWKNLGPRTTLWMLAIVILLGWFFNKP